jgi:CheY-like chemotaxis protein
MLPSTKFDVTLKDKIAFMQQHILVIDDDEDDCMLIKDSLFQVGLRYTVDIALGGQQALEMMAQMRSNPPLLIILDLNMPGMDGFEVLSKIASEYGTPVIMYTTACTDETTVKAKSLGAIDCVKKGTSYSDNLKFAKYITDLTKTFKL